MQVLKVDVEGYEPHVFDGMGDVRAWCVRKSRHDESPSAVKRMSLPPLLYIASIAPLPHTGWVKVLICAHIIGDKRE